MNRKILIILLLSISTTLFSQDRIQVVFNKIYTPGDYDLLIKEILEQNAYKVFVSYKADSLVMNADFVMKYEILSRKGRDELHKFNLKLYDKKGFLNEVNRTISYVNFGVSDAKEICSGLENLFKKSFTYNEDKKKKVKYFNIDFQVHKVDSASYFIGAFGAAIRSADGVKKAFLKKGQQYLNGFDHYTENKTYRYSAPGPMGSTYHTGNAVIGIIKGNGSANTITEMTIKPTEFER